MNKHLGHVAADCLHHSPHVMPDCFATRIARQATKYMLRGVDFQPAKTHQDILWFQLMWKLDLVKDCLERRNSNPKITLEGVCPFTPQLSTLEDIRGKLLKVFVHLFQCFVRGGRRWYGFLLCRFALRCRGASFAIHPLLCSSRASPLCRSFLHCLVEGCWVCPGAG